MALTITIDKHGVMGDVYYVRGSMDFDSSYPTGGEALTAANIGISQIDTMTIHTTSGYMFEYDYTNSLVLVYEGGFATGTTAAATDNSGALVLDGDGTEGSWRAIGIDTSTTVNTGALRQVADTTNLSSLTGVRFFAIGT